MLSIRHSAAVIAVLFMGLSAATVDAAEVVTGCVGVDGEFRKARSGTEPAGRCRHTEKKITRFRVIGSVPRGQSDTFPVANRFEIGIYCDSQEVVVPEITLEGYWNFGSGFGSTFSNKFHTLGEGFVSSSPFFITSIDDPRFVAESEDRDFNTTFERWNFFNGARGYWPRGDTDRCFVDIEGEIAPIALPD